MAACVLGRLASNSLLVGAFGWGLAVMIAIAIAGGVSGMKSDYFWIYLRWTVEDCLQSILTVTVR